MPATPNNGRLAVTGGALSDFASFPSMKMARSNLIVPRAQASATVSGVVMIIIIVVVIVCVIFCIVVLFLILRNKRRRKARAKKLEESRPMVPTSGPPVDEYSQNQMQSPPQNFPSPGPQYNSPNPQYASPVSQFQPSPVQGQQQFAHRAENIDAYTGAQELPSYANKNGNGPAQLDGNPASGSPQNHFAAELPAGGAPPKN